DGLDIEGGVPLRGTQVESHGDHRIAMSLAIAALIASDTTTILGAEAASISYPDFIETLRSAVGE
ncbi:MAG: 3-phosphoshikimate 1-carboxyvinyltransferase, partial [Geitlerinemataceae cyanobacterium]